MVLVILLFFLILAICLYLTGSQSMRESAIQSYLIAFGLAAVAIEFLSLINQITFTWILSSWLILIFIVSAWLIYILTEKGLGQRIALKKGLFRISKPSWLEWIILVVIGSILLITLLIALKAPPNNFDSMTYHMARVSNWIQQQSIKYYPTAIERQNYSMPLAEYMILHLQVLSKSDLYANLVQWSGFLIVILVVLEIARLFRISQTGQLIAALFSATMPIVILQSSSTQNDLLTGVFCLIFVYFLFQVIKSFSWKSVLLSGLGLGLAIFTKGTAYIYCGAMGLSLGGLSLIKNESKSRMKLISGFSVLILFALVLNAGVYYRNTRLYSHPLSSENSKILNENITPGIIYANLVRNGAMQSAIPVPALNERFTTILENHLGEKIIDPSSTFTKSEFNVKFLINEDEAGNLIHFILLSIFLLILPWTGDKKDIPIRRYTVGIIICILLYSAVFKWQPWGNRLQMPIFILGAPLVGYGIEKSKLSRTILLLGVIIFSFYSVPYLTLNSTRPLVPIFKKGSFLRTNQVRRFFSDRPPLYNEYAELIAPFYINQSVLRTDRQIQYFASTKSFQSDYLEVMSAVNQVETDWIGLHLGSNHLEYPIWVLADKHGAVQSPEFFHIRVVGKSGEIGEKMDLLPDYIISTKIKDRDWIDAESYNIVVDTPTIILLER